MFLSKEDIDLILSEEDANSSHWKKLSKYLGDKLIHAEGEVDSLNEKILDMEKEIHRLKMEIVRLSIPKRQIVQSKRPYKTYLIKNPKNNLYKIGRSKYPDRREKTLQSEDPTIFIVKVWDNDIESELHKKYTRQRVRGEWFRLSELQVKYITSHY